MNNQEHIKILQNIEQKILWLSTWMIHQANHIRPNPDGLKVGGHQASSASSVTILTSLFFAALRSYDKISIKPHASPVFHAIQYLMGRQKVENLINFRALGGAQSYPSRTKDFPEVDFSTGSVGLGVSITLFASLLQDYLKAHQLKPTDSPTGRMVALLGDAELDEGNIYESLLEGWKHNIGNLWWIVDYNRQSLDNITKNNLNHLLSEQFKSYGWRVVELKYGHQLQEFIRQPGGNLIAKWLDQCPHDLYSTLTYKRDHSWR
ncbi:MAG: transketolase, partial [Alphaproteobacteria bacterium]|nr:transketolase [Alphaproteobacteria bacterium]